MAMSPAAIESIQQDEDAAWNELRPVLHDEVHRLPEKYRLPVILCYLEGKTNEEVAEMLHWPVGTVKGRLSAPATCYDLAWCAAGSRSRRPSC